MPRIALKTWLKALLQLMRVLAKEPDIVERLIGLTGLNVQVSILNNFFNYNFTPFLLVTCGIGISMRTRTFIEHSGRKKCPHISVG